MLSKDVMMTTGKIRENLIQLEVFNEVRGKARGVILTNNMYESHMKKKTNLKTK